MGWEGLSCKSSRNRWKRPLSRLGANTPSGKDMLDAGGSSNFKGDGGYDSGTNNGGNGVVAPDEPNRALAFFIITFYL